MSLRINTNVAALNSYNNLNANQAKLEGAFQQLSSGLRINKAADDAAGLSIAQGLTSQINGLTQAVSNANDGINVAQIADGALGTTQDILQRMRGLVVKAANVGTQDSKSLGAIQQEVKNLNTQLDNIAGQTKFGQVNLLDGSYNKNFQVGANGGDTIKLNLASAGVYSTNIGGAGKTGSGIDLTQLSIAKNGASAPSVGWSPDSATAAADMKTALGIGATDGLNAATTIQRAPSGGEGWVITDGTNTLGTITSNGSGTFTVTDTTGDSPVIAGQINAVKYDDAFKKSDVAALVANGTAPVAPATSTLYDALEKAFGTTTAANTITVGAVSNNPDGTSTWSLTGAGTFAAAGNTVTGGKIDLKDGVYTISDNAGNKVAWIDSNAGAEAAAGAAVSYTTADSVTDLDNLGKAIDAISNARSQIGAVQNQLSYTVSNLQTAITNVTASRSNLTDADLAQQVTAMTQSQILTQAATSVLAQANSAPQAILKLLQ